jgi:hypothetical protein
MVQFSGADCTKFLWVRLVFATDPGSVCSHIAGDPERPPSSVELPRSGPADNESNEQ